MVQIQNQDDILTVHLEGELTYENTTDIKDEIKSHILSNTKKVIIELSKLDLIDSSGVGVFISLLRKMNGEGVSLAAPQPRIARVFEITKLDQIIPIYKTLDEALAK
jgi:anti-sigma B factor antagonist